MIRKRIKLVPEKAIFIFVGDILPATAALMSAIYEEYKDEDGFLYVRYAPRLTQLFRRKHIVRGTTNAVGPARRHAPVITTIYVDVAVGMWDIPLRSDSHRQQGTFIACRTAHACTPYRETRHAPLAPLPRPQRHAALMWRCAAGPLLAD